VEPDNESVVSDTAWLSPDGVGAIASGLPARWELCAQAANNKKKILLAAAQKGSNAGLGLRRQGVNFIYPTYPSSPVSWYHTYGSRNLY
jgi:hypothetical protein